MKRSVATSCALALGMGIVSATQLALAQATDSAVAQAQTVQAAQAQTAPEETLQRIEVTGSLIKRIEGETALPVQVVTKEDIQKSGVTTVEQLMQILPVFSSAANTVVAQAAGETSGSLSAISLHGLGSQRTLVLINGRRVVPYGIFSDSTSVDVNSIPIAAIERIEVLKEGASATYGSDAIAGVVNFILRSNFTGVEATAQYGDSTRGGGATETATLTYGFGNLAKDRFNVMVMAAFERDEELWGKDRSFAANGLDNLNYDATSSNTFPGNITPLSGPLAGTTLNPGYPNHCAPSTADPNYAAVATGYGQCRFDPSPYVPLLPGEEHDSLFASFNFALTPEWTAYAELSYNRNVNDQLEQPSPVSDEFTLPPGNVLDNTYPYNAINPLTGAPPNQNIYLAPSSPYYPFAYMAGAYTATGNTPPSSNSAYPILNVNYRTFLNGDRGLSDITATPRIVIGMKGTELGWDTDTSFVHATNRVTERTTGGYFINSELLPILNSGNFNLLWPALGPQPSAAQVAQMMATNFDGTAWVNETGIDDLTARASRDLAKLSGGPLGLGVGAEFRRERFDSQPNVLLNTGDVSGYGGNFLPVNVARSMFAAFAEVDAPFLKSFEADASVRFDHYQSVGSKTTPKLGLRWQPSQQVLVRGSIGKGFRAPSLTDLYAPQTISVTPVLTDPSDCQAAAGHGCSVQIPTLLGGNPNLKPETSTNVTWGIVLEPVRNLATSIDFFNIEVKNVIADGGVSPYFIFSNLSTYGYLVTRGGADPALPSCSTCFIAEQVNQLNLNLGAERVTGFDLDFRWLLPTAPVTGRFTVALHGTYYSKFQTQNPDNSYTDQIDTANQTLGNGGSGIIPRWRHRAELDWQKNDWDVLIAQNWQGSYADLGSVVTINGQNTTVGTYETYDLNVGYVGLKNWKLNLGVKNVFDANPPFTGAGGFLFFQHGYDPSYADPRGRFVYLAVGYKFK